MQFRVAMHVHIFWIHLSFASTACLAYLVLSNRVSATSKHSLL